MFKNKFIKWSFISLVCLISLIVLALVAFCVGERVIFRDFYKDAQKEFDIPGLEDGYVPQGFEYLDDRSVFLACGYMKDNSPSRIYVIGEDGSASFCEMLNADGSDHTGHTGGIARFGNYVYVTDKTGCNIFTLSDITDGDGKARIIGQVESCNDPAYCSVKDGLLYMGSFYREVDYETPMEHRFTTPAGDLNTAIIAAYRLDPESGRAVSSVPERIYSTTGAIQGMAFCEDGSLALSASWGISKSRIYVYDLERAEFHSENAQPRTVSAGGKDVKVTFLDSASLVSLTPAPPMAEEIVCKDGRIYIMNESASTKYMFGKLTTGEQVYSYPVSKAKGE